MSTSQQETEQTPPSSQEDDFVQIDSPEDGSDQSFESDFEKVPLLVGNTLPEDCHIKQVLGFFIRHTYTATSVDPRVHIAMDDCIELIERDYNVIKINNQDGALCNYYPTIIPFIDSERTNRDTIYENTVTSEELSELLHKAYRARCRQRFPVSVIMFKGKCVCRSSTLAGTAEVYGRMALGVIQPGEGSQSDQSLDEKVAAELAEKETGWKAVDELQIADIALLKQLKVSTIVDLMVENRKWKLGIPVTSSEKCDKDNEYHSNFNIISLPFPGCEFFKEFHDANFNAEGLCFNWDQPMCDAVLTVPDNPSLSYLNIDWGDYKKWDLIQMTQNYIKYILKYLQDNNSGILIHCISGWDRTPLFISLIRLSLWADGVIHTSLDTREMLYLTLAYDWMLFGHHLTDRLTKNEDILLFCFSVLKHIISDEFSLAPKSKLKRQNLLEFGLKSSDKKTDCPMSDEAENVPKDEEMLPVSPDPIGFPEESNDSIYFPVESQNSLIFPASPPENRTSPDILYPVPMEICDDPDSLESYKRTSPVEIPSFQDSDSRFGVESNCSGSSWQLVSATGSIRGSDSQSEVDTASSQGSHGEGSFSRKDKLTQIRRLFYKCYYQTITEKHVNYKPNGGMLKNILSNLTEIAQMLSQQTQQLIQ